MTKGFLFLLLCLSIQAQAYDLGVYGRTWDIQEIDLKQLIAEEMQQVDTRKIQNLFIKQAENFGKNLDPNDLPKAKITKTFYVDPSISLTKDIIINGKILYKKGTVVNPLEVVRPTENMLFFNGDDPEQLNFALKSIKENPYHLMLVMTKGNPIKLANNIHRPIYYATQGIISRFHITHVPSLLGVGHDENKNKLAITTLAEPFYTKIINDCWNGCITNTSNKEQNANV